MCGVYRHLYARQYCILMRYFSAEWTRVSVVDAALFSIDGS